MLRPKQFGAAAVFVLVTLGTSIWSMMKLSAANKVAKDIAEEHSPLAKELVKELKRNLEHTKISDLNL